MSEIEVYLSLGFRHITDWNAYDHILFVLALCAIYLWKDWKRVLLLVTAFTIGHSITLALAVFELVPFSPDLIELLIPITIMVTATYNLGVKIPDNFYARQSPAYIYLRYLLALVFGLIHGLGFSNYLRSLLTPNESIVTKLLAFNIGLELGQLVIVLLALVASGLFVSILRTKPREWNLVLSGVVFGMALAIMLGKLA